MSNLANYLVQHSKKYLIFDFDETLFTLEMPWEEYQREMKFRLHQFDPDFSEFEDVHDWENAITKKYGAKVAAIRWNYSAEFEGKYSKNEVQEQYDLTDFIREQGKKYQLFVWTSNMRSTAEPVLEKAGLLSFFSQLVTKGDVLLMKPDPEGFYKIFDPATQKKSKFLMIGNGDHDRDAASAAGIDFWLRP